MYLILISYLIIGPSYILYFARSPFFEEYSSCMVRQMTGICSEINIALFRGYCEIEKIVFCPTEDDR